MQVVLYARTSPKPQENESIDTQLDILREYCRKRGWDIIGEYSDALISGGNLDREGLSDAVDQVCRSKAILLVYKLSRFARDTDAKHIALRIDRSGGLIVATDLTVDLSSAVGRFIFKQLLLIDEFQREAGAEYTSQSMIQQQRNGKRVSSQCPYGRRRRLDDPAKMEKHPGEAEIPALVCSLREKGLTLDQIGDVLTERGYMPRGKTWHRKTISRILQRES